MSSVRFSSKTNSTLFTTCCNVAICNDQKQCPGCEQVIDLSPQQRWNIAMDKLYGRKRKRYFNVSQP